MPPFFENLLQDPPLYCCQAEKALVCVSDKKAQAVLFPMGIRQWFAHGQRAFSLYPARGQGVREGWKVKNRCSAAKKPRYGQTDPERPAGKKTALKTAAGSGPPWR